MALAVAQVTGTTGSGSGDAVATFGSATTAGSLIVGLEATYNIGANDGNVTDNKSNGYTSVEDRTGSGTTGVGCWYNNGGTRGASHSVTGTQTGAGASKNIAIIEITGQDSTAAVLDTTTHAWGTDTATPYDVTAAAAISGSQIAVYTACLDTGSNVAFTQPTGYSNIYNEPNGASALVSIGSYKLNETGTPTVGASSAHTPSNTRELFVTFIAAAGGGAAPGESSEYDLPDVYTEIDPVAVGVAQLDIYPLAYLPLSVDAQPLTADTIVVGRLDVGATFLATGRYDITPGGRLDVGAVDIGTISHTTSLAGILEAGAILYVPATHDATVAGILEAAAVPFGTVSHDATLVGLLEAGAFLMTGPSADVSVIGRLDAGAVLYAPISHAATVAAHLPAGAFLNPATTSHDVPTVANLPAGALPFATISHVATVAGLLPVGALQLATVTADRNVVGLLEAGAFLFVGPSGDVSVIGLLAVGAFDMAGTFRKDITPTGTLFAGIDQRTTGYSPNIIPGGLLEAAVSLQGTVSTTRTVAGHLAAAAAPSGGVTVVFSIAGRLYVGAFPNFDVSATFIDHAAYVATALERFFDEAREAFGDDQRERYDDGSQA